MAIRQMTFRDWYRSLGEALPLPVAAEALGCSQLELVKKAQRGEIKVYSFKAADGRVFRMVRSDDIRRHKSTPPKPQISLEGMARALQAMIDGDDASASHR